VHSEDEFKKTLENDFNYIVTPLCFDVYVKIESKKLKSTSKTIGREGERRICLPLTELKENEKKDLIEQLKKIAKEGQLVSVSIR
jgi:hypothetical protein